MLNLISLVFAQGFQSPSLQLVSFQNIDAKSVVNFTLKTPKDRPCVSPVCQKTPLATENKRCLDRTRDICHLPAAPMKVKRRVLIIFRQRGVPVKASRILMRIKSQESPALRTSGRERWRMFSWMRLEKCQHSWLDSEPFIRFRFIPDLSHMLYVTRRFYMMLSFSDVADLVRNIVVNLFEK